jgi:hypothetical protein
MRGVMYLKSLTVSIALKAVLVVLPCTLFASDPFPQWSDWEIEAHSVGCALQKKYVIPDLGSRTNKGMFENTKYIGGKFRFSANNFTHGDIIRQKDLGVIRLVLQLDSGSGDSYKDRNVIGGTLDRIEAEFLSPYGIPQLWLNEAQSEKLLTKIIDGDKIGLSLQLESGARIDSIIHSSPVLSGHVWVKMFRTCIAQHNRRR